MSTALHAAAPLFRRQHALVTGRQLRASAVHPQSVKRLVDRGIWERLDTSLYGPAGVPMTWRRRLLAATLIGPPGVIVSHRAAAALLGVGGLTEPTVEVTIPRGTSLRRPWLIAHESSDLHLCRPLLVDGIPVTDGRRLAMDLGSVVSFQRFKHTVRELRHGHGVTSESLLATYLRHKRRGRNGSAALRDWLDRYFDVQGVSESAIELVVLDAILDAGMPVPTRQVWVEISGRRYRLDLAYPRVKLVIEVDGSQHRDADVAIGDANRTEDLEAAGWTVVRIRSWRLASDLVRALKSIEHLVVASPQL